MPLPNSRRHSKAVPPALSWVPARLRLGGADHWIRHPASDVTLAAQRNPFAGWRVSCMAMTATRSFFACCMTASSLSLVKTVTLMAKTLNDGPSLP